MLNNDFLLPISFSMAAQIGLEETVLLTFLKQQSYVMNSAVLKMDIAQLSAQLPFWTVPMVMRLLANLQISQLLSFQRHDQSLEIQVVPMSGSVQAEAQPMPQAESEDSLMGKMNRLQQEVREKTTQTTRAAPAQTSQHSHFTPKQSQSTPPKANYAPRQAARQNVQPSQPPVVNDRRGITDFDLYLEQKELARQPGQWQPEETTLEQIAQAGITREFALSLQAEFLLRIKEQRKNVRTWNSEFFKYVKRQWQYKQSDRSSYEGTSGSSKFNKTSREQVSDALTNIHDTDW
ncbi:DnaT-like ssDNA-binding domain-containing protein [Marinomonas sp. TI.3.20]|uniref:DnaT-like ssDNA-binding domain-containing protein n=1 Tax=Marinomonas sp. TI.3.20 TaxID=3121296 RepID=UPI00311FE733